MSLISSVESGGEDNYNEESLLSSSEKRRAQQVGGSRDRSITPWDFGEKVAKLAHEQLSLNSACNTGHGTDLHFMAAEDIDPKSRNAKESLVRRYR